MMLYARQLMIICEREVHEAFGIIKAIIYNNFWASGSQFFLLFCKLVAIAKLKNSPFERLS